MSIGAGAGFFKDEFWHWRHKAGLKVALLDQGVVLAAQFELLLTNPSRRTGADGVTVRVIDLHPHPWEAESGPRGIDPTVRVNTLLPSASGSTRFDLSPKASVRLPLLRVKDAFTRDDPVLAELSWAQKTTVAGPYTGGLLVLPSASDRFFAEGDESRMSLIETPAPARIEIEVAARNVPARYYEIQIWRDPSTPLAYDLPGNPNSRSGAFRVEIVPAR